MEGGGRFFGNGKQGFKERGYMRNETWGRGWRKKDTEWKRNSYQDGKGLLPPMDEKGSTDGKENLASWNWKQSPHETESTEWKRNSFQEKKRKDDRIEEERRHRWRREGARKEEERGPEARMAEKGVMKEREVAPWMEEERCSGTKRNKAQD